MIKKQILLILIFFSITNNVLLSKTMKSNLHPFDKGIHTTINNHSWLDTLNDHVKIIRITNNQLTPRGTIKSFKKTLKIPPTPDEFAFFLVFYYAIEQNNAFFDSKNQKIFYGSELDINNYCHKQIDSINKRLQEKSNKLQWKKTFLQRSCKDKHQGKKLKEEIKKEEQELDQLYETRDVLLTKIMAYDQSKSNVPPLSFSKPIVV